MFGYITRFISRHFLNPENPEPAPAPRSENKQPLLHSVDASISIHQRQKEILGCNNAASKDGKNADTPISARPEIKINQNPSSSALPSYRYISSQSSPSPASFSSQSDQFSSEASSAVHKGNQLNSWYNKPEKEPETSTYHPRIIIDSRSSPSVTPKKTNHVWVQKSSHPDPVSSQSSSIKVGTKPSLCPSPSNSTDHRTKAQYVWVQKNVSSAYVIPETIKEMIKRDIVPEVLKRPLTPETYKDFFAALLYAEDFYIEKWSNFQLKNVSVEMHSAAIYNKNANDCEEKDLVTFKLESVRERRPFLLSRDFVFLRPLGSNVEPFQGIIYRVVKSNLILVEFEDTFHRQHHSSHKYDVSFSFNRVCLKRAHQAIASASASASDQLFRDLIFPVFLNRNLTSPEPYFPTQKLGLEHNIVVFKIGDSETDIFRANAAFREPELVVEDILSSCPRREDCFTCPSRLELQNFKVILSTYMSSYRLCAEGLNAGHFSHVFLVDASGVTEPEAMVTLTHLVGDETAVIITGAPNHRSRWVRSNISRSNGLMRSYFERLAESKSYSSHNPMLIRCL